MCASPKGVSRSNTFGTSVGCDSVGQGLPSAPRCRGERRYLCDSTTRLITDVHRGWSRHGSVLNKLHSVRRINVECSGSVAVCMRGREYEAGWDARPSGSDCSSNCGDCSQAGRRERRAQGSTRSILADRVATHGSDDSVDLASCHHKVPRIPTLRPPAMFPLLRPAVCHLSTLVPMVRGVNGRSAARHAVAATKRDRGPIRHQHTSSAMSSRNLPHPSLSPTTTTT